MRLDHIWATFEKKNIFSTLEVENTLQNCRVGSSEDDAAWSAQAGKDPTLYSIECHSAPF